MMAKISKKMLLQWRIIICYERKNYFWTVIEVFEGEIEAIENVLLSSFHNFLIVLEILN